MDFNYYGSSAEPPCKHEFAEIKRGDITNEGKVVSIKTFRCPKCLSIESKIITRYPTY